MSSLLFLGSFVAMPLFFIWRFTGFAIFYRLLATFVIGCVYLIPSVGLGFALSAAAEGGDIRWKAWVWPGSFFLDKVYASTSLLEIMNAPYYLLVDIIRIIVDINIHVGGWLMWGPELFGIIIFVPQFITIWTGRYDI